MKKSKDITPIEKQYFANKFNITLTEVIKARNAYHSQKASCNSKLDALKNPVEMRLSFEEWLDIWMQSGHWEKRGKLKNQYCMCRKNDIGHYEVGNVYIDLSSANSSMALVAERTIEYREMMRQKYLGKSRPIEMWDKIRETKIKNGRYKSVISEVDGKGFISIADAARYYNLDPSTINDRCKKQIKGFRFA